MRLPRKSCFAPSEVVSSGDASAFGLIAEQFVGRDYLQRVGRSAFFPASTIDFQDISSGFGNVTLLISFLKTNNPHLTASKLLVMSAEFALVKVPDLMTHDPPRRTEFYEIKPNSPDGRFEG